MIQPSCRNMDGHEIWIHHSHRLATILSNSTCWFGNIPGRLIPYKMNQRMPEAYAMDSVNLWFLAARRSMPLHKSTWIFAPTAFLRPWTTHQPKLEPISVATFTCAQSSRLKSVLLRWYKPTNPPNLSKNRWYKHETKAGAYWWVYSLPNFI